MRIKPAAASLRLKTEIRWKHSLLLRQSKLPDYTGDFVTGPAATQTIRLHAIDIDRGSIFIWSPISSSVRVVWTREECYSRTSRIEASASSPGHTPGIWDLFLSGIARERRSISSCRFSLLEISLDFMLQVLLIITIIIHCTHYQHSDWPRNPCLFWEFMWFCGQAWLYM